MVVPTLLFSGHFLNAADRVGGFVPIHPDAVSKNDDRIPAIEDDVATSGQNEQRITGTERANLAWRNYRRMWREFHADPASASLRRYLGMKRRSSKSRPSGDRTNGDRTSSYNVKTKSGRAAPAYLNWKPRSYAQIDTPHFTIHSIADRQASMQVAEELENTYWLWTQWFFPFWSDAPKVVLQMGKMDPDSPIADQLSKSRFRLTTDKPMQVVLFRDATQYINALRADNPGIEKSTGFYHDAQRTIFLFSGSQNDSTEKHPNNSRLRETLQHELVHQLFREASLSKLGRTKPGEQRDFWLVEGIAGYFESMIIDGGVASVGGWDAPRMQFSRYRVLANGDTMSLGELRRDGRHAAQGRPDLARWYAHSILRTHWLMDGQVDAHVQWLFHQLADVYQMDVEASGFESLLDSVSEPNETEHSLNDFLIVDDEHLLSNSPMRKITQLCLTHCKVTGEGIASLNPMEEPIWLDLSYCQIDSRAVERLVPDPRNLKQLSLERTEITDELAPWLDRATVLEEVDLSWTRIGDRSVSSLSHSKHLEVLWLTGTNLTDRAMEELVGFPQLTHLDVQRSKVSPEKIQWTKRKFPELLLNSLHLRPEHP